MIVLFRKWFPALLPSSLGLLNVRQYISATSLSSPSRQAIFVRVKNRKPFWDRYRLVFVLLGLLSFAVPFYSVQDAIVLFNGQRLDYHQPLLVNNNLLAVPLSETAKQLGVAYLTDKQTVILKDGHKEIVFQKNHDKVIVNGQAYYLPQKCMEYQSEWYVPLNYLAWYLGYTLHRKDRFYYVSKLLSKAVIDEKSVQLVFSCKVSDKDMEWIKEGGNRYSIQLRDTVLSFPKISQKNATFQEVYLGQVSLTPDLAKMVIVSNKELEWIREKNIIVIKPVDVPVEVTTEKTGSVEPQKMILANLSPAAKSSETATKIPSLKGIRNLQLSVKGKKSMVSGAVRYNGEYLVLPADEVLLPFGYDYSVNSSGELLVKYGDKEEIHTGILAYKTGKRIDVPIQLVAAALGMGLRWDYRINTLYINPVVYAVHYEKGENGEQISIHSHSEINPKSIFELDKPSRLILDIPNAVLDIASRNLPISSSNFLAVRVGQLDEETVRMVVDLKLSKSYGLSLSDDGLTAFILGAGKLQRLGYIERESMAQLTLYSNRLASFNVSFQDQQLILDLEDMIYGAKPGYFFQGEFLDKVFGAQHSWAPLSSRMNVYLKKDVSYKLDKVTDNLVLTLRKKYVTATGKDRKSEQAVTSFKKLPLSGKTIVIESGHGGLDVGAIGFGGLYEKNFTLDISKRIQSRLIQAGATVLMPIQSDQYLSLSARTMFANRNGADFFLSVHLNSSNRADLNGTETYYYKPEDLPPAKIIHEALLKHLRQEDKGIRKARFFVLFHTTMPAVLIEPAYLSNAEQYNLLLTDDFKNQIVDGVVEGILKYYEK